MEVAKQAIESFILDPQNHDILAILKGLRNGIVYGTKVRFPHALVMIFLFRSGTFREKVRLIYKATRTHARNLGTFVLIYKSSMLLLRTLQSNKQQRHDSFLAGLLGGYVVFGRGAYSSVNQQIVIYVFARVVLGLAKLSVSEGNTLLSTQTKETITNNTWPVFASLSWAFVMFLFKEYPEVIQPSLRSSMKYLYVNSEQWDGLRNFIWHNV